MPSKKTTKKNSEPAHESTKSESPAKSQAAAEVESPAFKKLKTSERELLIKWWRDHGWTYEKIVAKFEAGITEEEYAEIIARIEAA